MDYSDIDNTRLRFTAYFFQVVSNFSLLVALFTLLFQFFEWLTLDEWYFLPWFEIFTGLSAQAIVSDIAQTTVLKNVLRLLLEGEIYSIFLGATFITWIISKGIITKDAARRLAAERALLLVDELPPEQPVRQQALSAPYPLSFLFAGRPDVRLRVGKSFLSEPAARQSSRRVDDTGAETPVVERDVAHLIFPDEVQVIPAAAEASASSAEGRFG